MTTTQGLPVMTGQTYSALPPTLPNTGRTATTAQMEAAAMKEYQSNPAIANYIQQQFGYIGTFLMSVPELAPIVVSAGIYGWNQAEFDGAVQQTNWWRTTSQAQRNFQELRSSDPATAAQQVTMMQNTILSTAQSLGITIPLRTITPLATLAVQWNWTTDTITQMLRTRATPTAHPQFGAAATFADQARQLAGEYAVSLPTSTLASYVQQATQGKLTADGLQNTFAQQATALYPWMKTAIAQGVTPSQYLSSYASAAAQTLGKDASDITWTTPKYMKALMTGKTGQSVTAPVNVGQFQQNLMKTPQFGYQNTQGARDQAYAMAGTILQSFGRVKA